jgi:hypothetical protein
MIKICRHAYVNRPCVLLQHRVQPERSRSRRCISLAALPVPTLPSTPAGGRTEERLQGDCDGQSTRRYQGKPISGNGMRRCSYRTLLFAGGPCRGTLLTRLTPDRRPVSLPHACRSLPWGSRRRARRRGTGRTSLLQSRGANRTNTRRCGYGYGTCSELQHLGICGLKRPAAAVLLPPGRTSVRALSAGCWLQVIAKGRPDDGWPGIKDKQVCQKAQAALLAHQGAALVTQLRLQPFLRLPHNWQQPAACRVIRIQWAAGSAARRPDVHPRPTQQPGYKGAAFILRGVHGS